MRTFIRVKVFRSIAALVLTGLYLDCPALGGVRFFAPLLAERVVRSRLLAAALVAVVRGARGSGAVWPLPRGAPGQMLVSRALLAVLLWTNCVGTVGFFTNEDLRPGVPARRDQRLRALDHWTEPRQPRRARDIASVAFSPRWRSCSAARVRSSDGRWACDSGSRWRSWASRRWPAWFTSMLALPRFPPLGALPVALLLDRTLPNTPFPAAPPGSGLGRRLGARHPDSERNGRRSRPRSGQFNVVVLVMESTRASSFWPSAQAPALPHVAALAPHAVTFTARLRA